MHFVDWVMQFVAGMTNTEKAIQFGDMLLETIVIVPMDGSNKKKKEFTCGKSLYRFKKGVRSIFTKEST